MSDDLPGLEDAAANATSNATSLTSVAGSQVQRAATLTCSGMAMVGWLPDLFATVGAAGEQGTANANFTTPSSSYLASATISSWGVADPSIILPSIP